MKATILAAMAVAVLSGCGGGPDPAPAPLPDLNPAMGGTWTGNSVVSVPAVSYSASSPSQLEVAVAGKTATISKVCPDGSGTVAATGGGNAVAWAGTLTCPAVAIPQCASVIVTLSSASGSLSADATTLTALAAGKAGGCGYTFDATLTFTGTK